MSLTAEEKKNIHERVERMNSKERRARLEGYVNEFLLKTIFAHIVFLGYCLFSFYVNFIFSLNIFIVIVQIGVGIFLVRVSMILHQSLLFFRNANNLVKSFDKGIGAGIKYIDEMSEDL